MTEQADVSTSTNDDRMPLSYVYRAQIQGAAKDLLDALDLWDDGYVLTHPYADREIAEKIATARQRIENIYELKAEGVES
jgi:hypothetical protein